MAQSETTAMKWASNIRGATVVLALVALNACGFREMGLRQALKELDAHCSIAFDEAEIARIMDWRRHHTSFDGSIAVVLDSNRPQPDAACIRNFVSKSGYRFSYYPIRPATGERPVRTGQ